jgi:phosphate:Na+ symporter
MEPQSGATDWRGDMVEMCELAINMLRQASQAFSSQQVDSLDAADKLGRLLHAREKALAQRIVHRTAGSSFVLDSDRSRLFIPLHLERGGEKVEGLIRAVRTMVLEGVPFTDRARREVAELFAAASELVVNLRDVLLTGNQVLRRHVIDSGQSLVARADDCAMFHQQRLIEGVCAPRSSPVYLAILEALKGVEWHAREIAQKLEHPTADDLEEIGLALRTALPANAAATPASVEGVGVVARPSPVGWVP